MPPTTNCDHGFTDTLTLSHSHKSLTHSHKTVARISVGHRPPLASVCGGRFRTKSAHNRADHLWASCTLLAVTTIHSPTPKHQTPNTKLQTPNTTEKHRERAQRTQSRVQQLGWVGPSTRHNNLASPVEWFGFQTQFEHSVKPFPTAATVAFQPIADTHAHFSRILAWFIAAASEFTTDSTHMHNSDTNLTRVAVGTKAAVAITSPNTNRSKLSFLTDSVWSDEGKVVVKIGPCAVRSKWRALSRLTLGPPGEQAPEAVFDRFRAGQAENFAATACCWWVSRNFVTTARGCREISRRCVCHCPKTWRLGPQNGVESRHLSRFERCVADWSLSATLLVKTRNKNLMPFPGMADPVSLRDKAEAAQRRLVVANAKSFAKSQKPPTIAVKPQRGLASRSNHKPATTAA